MENQTQEKKYEIVKIQEEPFIKTDKTVHLSNYIAEDEDLEITIPFPTIEALIAFNDTDGYDALYSLENYLEKIGKRKGFLDFRTDVVSILEGIIDSWDNLYQSNKWCDAIEDFKKELREELGLTEENESENEEFEEQLNDFEECGNKKPFCHGVIGDFNFGNDVIVINSYVLDLQDITPRIADAKFISLKGLIFSENFIYYHNFDFWEEKNRSFHNIGYEEIQPLLEAKFKKWHPSYSISFDRYTKYPKFEHFILIDGKTISLIEE